MELSKLQKRIVESEEKKIVVMASAASGKTRALTERVRFLLRKGVEPSSIAVITFTNMAASELRNRLGEDYKTGLFIGTIHSLANHFLLSSGIDTSTTINNEDFDALFSLVQKNPDCVKHYNYVLLDEAQDSNVEQFFFIFNIINPENFFICGDVKQSIYGFAGAQPTLLKKLSKSEGVVSYSLNENYRNCNQILLFAKDIIEATGEYDDSIAMRKDFGRIVQVELSLPAITKGIKKMGQFKDWAILTRTNDEIQRVIYQLKKDGLPYDTFKQSELKKEELTQRMNENTIKVLTMHSAKGLEWNNVVVIGARTYNCSEEELNLSYVAATRARDLLIWTKYPRKKKQTIYNW